MAGRNELSAFAGFLNGVVTSLTERRQRKREDAILAQRQADRERQLGFQQEQLDISRGTAERNKTVFDQGQALRDQELAQNKIMSDALAESQRTGKPFRDVVTRMFSEAPIPAPKELIDRFLNEDQSMSQFRLSQRASAEREARKHPPLPPDQAAIQRVNEQVNKFVAIGTFGGESVANLIAEFGDAGFTALVRSMEYDVDDNTGQLLRKDSILRAKEAKSQFRVNLAKGTLDNDPLLAPDFKSIDFQNNDGFEGDIVKKVVFDITKNRNFLINFDENQAYSLADIGLLLANNGATAQQIIEIYRSLTEFFIKNKDRFTDQALSLRDRQKRIAEEERRRVESMSTREKFGRPQSGQNNIRIPFTEEINKKLREKTPEELFGSGK